LDVEHKQRQINELTQERDYLTKEGREKSDAMAESLLANNQQARQLWEDKLKDL
jgi:polyhydroxyalkanoate synthesis regulator phasin